MKIGIDISQIVYGTGVSVYTQNLVQSLLEIDKSNEYLLFASSLRLRKVLDNFCDSLSGNYKTKIYPFPPVFLEWLWNRWHVLAIEILTGKIDLFHSSDWLEPPAKCPKITTIHDLAILKYPENFLPKGGHDIVANTKRKLELVKKESAAIIAVSENTKKDIIELLGIPERKIHVVYEGIPRWLKKVSTEKVEKIKEKYRIEGNYLLSVSTLEPRKNIARIIEAHKLLMKKNKDLLLVLVGKIGWGESLNIGRNTVVTGYVYGEELCALYSGASALVFPTLYEGFGLPILEAMSCGCPVVTSNVSSMPEVAGEAAVLVDPLSLEGIAEGIKEALENREELIKKGYEQVKKFSWEKAAEETLTVYQKALGK